jgi:hypothetical protein
LCITFGCNNWESMVPPCTCNNYVWIFKQSTLYWHYLQGGPFEQGLDKNEFVLKRVHIWRDVSKLMVIVANYAFESSFMTPHLEGEEVFGSTKHNVFSKGRWQVA